MNINERKVTRTMSRVQRALLELDYLDRVITVREARNFVEIVGQRDGVEETHRVYFKDGDNVDYVR